MTLEEKFKNFREDGYKEGKEEGIQENKIEMCRNMLSEDLPVLQISRITGLSEDEILKIKSEFIA